MGTWNPTITPETHRETGSESVEEKKHGETGQPMNHNNSPHPKQGTRRNETQKTPQPRCYNAPLTSNMLTNKTPTNAVKGVQLPWTPPPAEGTTSRKENKAAEPGPRANTGGNGTRNEIRRTRDHFSPGYHRSAAKRFDTVNSFLPLTYAQVLSSPPRQTKALTQDNNRINNPSPKADDPFKDALAGSLTQKENGHNENTPEPDLSLEYVDPESPTPAPKVNKKNNNIKRRSVPMNGKRDPKERLELGVGSPNGDQREDGDESMHSASPVTRQEAMYQLTSPRAPTPAHQQAQARRFNTDPPRTEGMEHRFRFAPHPPRGWSTSINGDNMGDQNTFTTAKEQLEKERREERALEEQIRRSEFLLDQPRIAQLQPQVESNQNQVENEVGERAIDSAFHDPIGGTFPEVHGLDEQRCKELIPKEQVEYYDDQALRIATQVLLLLRSHDNPSMCPTARAADVLAIVKKALPGPSNFIIGSPNYPLKPRSAQHVLVPCIGTNFTEEQAAVLLERRYWGTDKTSIFILPWKGAMSAYLFSIMTLNVDPDHPSE
uniref:Uncharacterized protein n=1 Tax=Psilocybe cubensis TaxID=181762 RepID=A0A8H7XY64_PSICU